MIFPLSIPPFQLWEDMEVNFGECTTLFDIFKRKARIQLVKCDHFESSLKYMEDQAQEAFQYSTYNYSADTNYINCVSLENEIRPSIFILTKKVIFICNLTRSLITAPTPSDALDFAKQVAGLLNDLYNVGILRLKYHDTLDKYCSWLQKILSKTSTLVHESSVDLKVTLKTKEEIKKSYDDVRSAFNKVYETHENITKTIVKGITNYIDGNLTKLQFGQAMADLSFKKRAEKLCDLYSVDLNDAVSECVNEVQYMGRWVSNIYVNLLRLKYDVLNTSNVFELDWVKQAKALNDSRLVELVDRLKWNVSKFLELIDETYYRLTRPVEELNTLVIKPVEDFCEQLQVLTSSLQIYHASAEMDTEFFL